MPKHRDQQDHALPPSRRDGATRDHRCAWTTSGRRCFLPGAMSNGIGDGIRLYCHWHFLSVTNPRWGDDYDEFVRWQAAWQGYCSPENHYHDSTLWAAVRGERDLPSVPEQWCGHVTCRYFDLTQTLEWAKAKRLDDGAIEVQPVTPLARSVTTAMRQAGATGPLPYELPAGGTGIPGRMAALRKLLGGSNGDLAARSELALKSGYSGEEIKVAIQKLRGTADATT